MEGFIKFYSNASPPYHQLSNFHHAPFIFTPENMSETMKEQFPKLEEWLEDGVTFSSSEHLWQALKAKDKKTFLKFTQDGEFDVLNAEFFEKIDSSVNGANKVAYWSKKNNVGIVPKMVSNHSSKFGLSNKYNTKDLYLEEEIQEFIWLDILRQKYEQNKDLKKLLLSTDDQYLLEFDKGLKVMVLIGEDTLKNQKMNLLCMVKIKWDNI